MNERKLLEHIYARSAGMEAENRPVLVGPGDDCALVTGAAEHLLTVDQLVEGVHFTTGTDVELIARKAIARSVSDIAACGGTVQVCLATGAIPAAYEQADELFDAMRRWAAHWGTPLVGGDIARIDGSMVLTCTMIGVPHGARGAVLRSGAQVGDGVFVTGALGGSFQTGMHLRFEPRLKESAWLCDVLGNGLHAMIDVSDGLGMDAGRIGVQSGVRLRLWTDHLPLCDLGELKGGKEGWKMVNDGEDHELVFTASGDVPDQCPATGTRISRIGEVVESCDAEQGCVFVLGDGSEVCGDEGGWSHATGEAGQ